MHKRNRTERVVVSALTATAAALWLGGVTGCASGNTDADYVRVCKDPVTGERVEDDKCPKETSGTSSHHHSGPGWVYIRTSRRGVSVPAVGHRVPSGFTDTAPPAGKKVTTSKRSGGSYSKGSSRGGFGRGSGHGWGS